MYNYIPIAINNKQNAVLFTSRASGNDLYNDVMAWRNISRKQSAS